MWAEVSESWQNAPIFPKQGTMTLPFGTAASCCVRVHKSRPLAASEDFERQQFSQSHSRRSEEYWR